MAKLEGRDLITRADMEREISLLESATGRTEAEEKHLVVLKDAMT